MLAPMAPAPRRDGSWFRKLARLWRRREAPVDAKAPRIAEWVARGTAVEARVRTVLTLSEALLVRVLGEEATAVDRAVFRAELEAVTAEAEGTRAAVAALATDLLALSADGAGALPVHESLARTIEALETLIARLRERRDAP
jgi:hypothetical protein